jgi:hypothetical protein
MARALTGHCDGARKRAKLQGAGFGDTASAQPPRRKRRLSWGLSGPPPKRPTVEWSTAIRPEQLDPTVHPVDSPPSTCVWRDDLALACIGAEQVPESPPVIRIRDRLTMVLYSCNPSRLPDQLYPFGRPPLLLSDRNTQQNQQTHDILRLNIGVPQARDSDRRDTYESAAAAADGCIRPCWIEDIDDAEEVNDLHRFSTQQQEQGQDNEVEMC